MNNEPVAYVNSMCNDYIDWKIDPMSIDGQSLYTHPAKTLTDEEIADFEWAIKNVLNFSQSEKVVGLDNVIRAILRKVQE